MCDLHVLVLEEKEQEKVQIATLQKKDFAASFFIFTAFDMPRT